MHKNSKTSRNATAIAIAIACAGQTIHAQSADALIDKLVDKGILTVKEAKDLREEADKGFTSAYQAKSGMPDWVTAFKLNGDFRGRYDGIFNPEPVSGAALVDGIVSVTECVLGQRPFCAMTSKSACA
jgi:hypothetical protein